MSRLKEAFKRFLSVALSVTTTVWLSGLTLLLPVSPALAVAPGDYGLTEGDLIRAPSLPAPEGFKVYIVNQHGFKRHIFNPDVFNMYGHFSWNSIKDVSPDVVNAFTTSDLYRIDGDPRVWSVDANGQKHWVNMTAEQFVSEGYNWNQIFIVNQTEGNYYTQGSDITAGGVTPPPAGGGVSASLSPNTPAAGVLAASTVFNKVLTVRFTAGSQAASISGLTVTKTGLVANTNISGISLWQGDTRVSNVLTSLTADGKANFVLGTPISVPASSSVDIDVKINLGASATSGTVGFMVNGVGDVNAGGSVSGTFPIQGNTFSLASAGQLAAYTISAQSPGGNSSSFPDSGSGNLEIGVTQREIAKFQFNETSGNENLLLKQLVIYTEGSIREGDLVNWTLYDPNNNVLAVGSVKMPYITFNLPAPYSIPEGTNRNLSIKADPVDGADRTVRVHVQNSYDIIATGAETGANVAPTSFSDTASASGYWRLKQGALTVTKSANAPSGSIAVGATEVELARFDLRAAGEQLEVRKLDLEIVEALSTSTQLLTGNVKVQSLDGNTTYLSLAADTSSLQRTSDSADSTRFDLNTYLVINSGETKTIKVVGTLKTTVGSGQTYQAKVGNFHVWRSSTKDFTDLLASTYTKGNNLSVETSALTIAKNTSVADKNVAKGSTAQVIGSYTFQAGSAEAVNISTITVGYESDPSSELANVEVYVNGQKFGSTIGTPNATSDAFNDSMQVAKSSTVIVEVRADVLSGVTTDDTLQTTIDAVGGTGANTGNTVNGTNTSGTTIVAGTPVTGQTVTYKTGTLQISRDAASAASQILLAGTNGVELSKVRFEALNDTLTLTKVRFETSVSGAGKYIARLFLCDGTSDSSSACVTGVTLLGDEALFSGISINLPAGSSKVLTVKANLASAANAISASTDVQDFAVQIKSDGTDDLTVNGSQGQLTTAEVNTSAADSDIAASRSFLMHLTAPIITKKAVSSSTLGGSTQQEIFKFTLKSANANVPLNVGEIQISLTATGMNTAGSIDTFKLYRNGELVAQDTTTTIATSTSSVTLTFNEDNEANDAFDSASSNSTNHEFDEGIEVSSTEAEFVLKADTTAATTGVTNGTVTLVAEISGARGADSSADDEEDDWADGNVFYSYKRQDGSNTYIGSAATETTSSANHFSASDSYTVDSQVLSVTL